MNYFDEYYLGAFRKFATFSGRARRKEYGWFLVFNFIVGIIISVVDFLAFGNSDGFFSLIYTLVVFIPGLAVLVRRLHDFGKSGWYFLAMIFIPVFVFIFGFLFIKVSEALSVFISTLGVALFLYYYFLLIFKKGDEGENAYGSDSKALNL